MEEITSFQKECSSKLKRWKSILFQAASRGSGSQSPPLPPPPPPEDEHEAFGRPRTSTGVMPIVPDEDDLPGWVPKNYIEKGKNIRDNWASSLLVELF